MMKKIAVLILLSQFTLKSQDTFSILAYDSITGEIGGAGASCVDLYKFPFFTNHFIIELFPDTGAVATQAAYIQSNQYVTGLRMRAGDRPTELLNYMYNNDNSPEIRQYGVIRKVNDTILTAAFTGTNCQDYKNHIVGKNYTIHGNILLGQQVLDSMEARFLRAEGSLACKLMAAMQGANMVGADTRCASNNSSSLFAFLKVTLPTDTFGRPSLLISLKTKGGDSIEPIDSLQVMFDALQTCTVSTTGLSQVQTPDGILVFPNPAGTVLHLRAPGASVSSCSVSDLSGRIILRTEFKERAEISLRDLDRGIYMVEVRQAGLKVLKKVILN